MTAIRILTVVLLSTCIGLSACSPKVGSDKWCEQMKEKDKGDWTASEAADYAEHCVFKDT